MITSEKTLEEQLSFEMILAEVLARFVNLPAEQIGTARLRDLQSILCERLGVDICSLLAVVGQDSPRLSG